jgi:hypothetical protein
MIGNRFQKYFKSFLSNKNSSVYNHLNEIINYKNEFSYTPTKNNKSLIFFKQHSILQRYIKDSNNRNTYRRNMNTKHDELKTEKVKIDHNLNGIKLNSNLAREFIKTLTTEERQIIKQELIDLEKENINSELKGIF